MIQSEGYLGRLRGTLLKTGLPRIKNVIKPSAKSVWIPLGLTAVAAAAAAVDAGIHKKILGSGRRHSSSFVLRPPLCDASHNTATLIISKNEIEDIIKIVKSLKDSGLLLKGVTKTVQNEVKEQKGGFLSMLLGTLGASLFGNLLAGRGIYRAGKGKEVLRAGEGIVRAGYGHPSQNKMDF